MSGWERIKAINKRLDSGFIGPGDWFDIRTYKGCIRAFLFWVAATYFMWHVHDFFAWERHIFSIPYEIDVAKQRWAQIWAWIIGGTGMVSALILMIKIPVDRHLARKSARGQWYDKPDLTAQDLQGKKPNDEHGNTTQHHD